MRTILKASTVLAVVLVVSCDDAARKVRPSTSTLLIDPLLIAEAAEVWSLVAQEDNPVWPGWNASKTPLLFYLPGKQDVLINHRMPPMGFIRYSGPIQFPGGKITVRTGKTLFSFDGQNTSRKVKGTQTLVVADTLSNQKQQMSALLQDTRSASEKIEDLAYEALRGDPYDSMGMIAHEAFHVFQSHKGPNKGGDESALQTYPVLSARNNVGFALEGDALAEAMRAATPQKVREAAAVWLAVRQDRRAALSPEAIAYEDGTEFNEGLAKYVEYRLTRALEARTPAPAMYWAQGFDGYEDLTRIREGLVDEMQKHMHGEVNVNNDPYGASPLRMRLYYSGMAVAVLLDTLSPGWHERIWEPETTLTQLATEAMNVKPGELTAALSTVTSGPGYDTLTQTKRTLEADGRRHVDGMLAGIEQSENGWVIIDYSALSDPDIGLSYTPFGVTGVDEDRTIYRLVPIRARMGYGYSLTQTGARPMLHDRKRRLFQLPLADKLTDDRLREILSAVDAATSSSEALKLSLPGVTVSAARASVQSEGERVTITLLPRPVG